MESSRQKMCASNDMNESPVDNHYQLCHTEHWQVYLIKGRLMKAFRGISIIAVVALLVALVGNSLFVYANPGLAESDEIECTPYPHYKPGTAEEYDDNDADADAAAALELNGYTCTPLLNKGPLPSTFQHVGQLWQKKDGTINRIRIIIFGDSNTGCVDAKICLDDDDEPINYIAPGDPPPCYCLGADAPNVYDQLADEGPSYGPGDAKPAAADPEEGPGSMEIRIEGLNDVLETWGGTQVGGWNINIDDYSEAILHFNKGEYSIVAYYQPYTEPSCTKVFGYKWHDISHDGVWDQNEEPPLNGWTITLSLPDGTTLDAVTGDGDWEDGYYEFEVCDLGSYNLSEELLTGNWSQTYPTTNRGKHTFEVTDLQQEWGPYNFGNTLCTKIFGYKWGDINHDGQWDPGEPPLDGWTITLTLPDESTLEAVTGAGDWEDGYYEFEVCELGSYELSETLLTVDWNQTFPPDPGIHPAEITDLEQEGYGPYNFGNAETCRTICGYKWHDKDEDGVWDDGEPPLNGWTINLVGAESLINETAITRDDPVWGAGYYEFIVCDVQDAFTLSEESQQTWYQTSPLDPGTHEVEVDTFNDGAGRDGPFNFGNGHNSSVGFEVYPVNKSGAMAPWIALFAAIIAGALLFVRHRQAQT